MKGVRIVKVRLCRGQVSPGDSVWVCISVRVGGLRVGEWEVTMGHS